MTKHFVPALPGKFAALADELEHLATQIADRFVADGGRHDPTFFEYAELAALFRSSTASEGRLLEHGLRILLKAEDRLLVIEPGFKLACTREAFSAVKSNDARALAALRIDPDSYTDDHYTPDLVVVDRTTQCGYVMELKRTTKNYGRGQISALSQKMLAAGLALSPTLFKRGCGTPVTHVATMLVDCSNSDEQDGVIGTGDLDHELDCPGLGAALDWLRGRFAHRVRSQIRDCIARIEGHLPVPGNTEVLGPDRTQSVRTQSENDAVMMPAACPVRQARKRRGAGRARPDAQGHSADVAVHNAGQRGSAEMAKDSAPDLTRGSGRLSISAIVPEDGYQPDAELIATAVRLGVSGEVDKTGVPASLRRALREKAAQGEPAAQLVLDWLDRLLLSRLDEITASMIRL